MARAIGGVGEEEGVVGQLDAQRSRALGACSTCARSIERVIASSGTDLARRRFFVGVSSSGWPGR